MFTLDANTFAISIIIFVGCFLGLAFSFYPFVVPNQLTLYEAASAPESLLIMFYGAVLVIPVITIYTGFAYYTFKGKGDSLRYY